MPDEPKDIPVAARPNVPIDAHRMLRRWLDYGRSQHMARHLVADTEAMLAAAPTPPADGQAQPDNSNYVSCGCGDMYPPDSYEAGFIAGTGHCENCEAGQPREQTIRDAALEEAAEAIELMNESAGDAASYDQREMTDWETAQMRALSAVVDRIRALKSQPAASSQDRKDACDIEAAAKTLAGCMNYPWEPMPEQGRESMRRHAQSVIDAARSVKE
jgi:hypothetical protein